MNSHIHVFEVKQKSPISSCCKATCIYCNEDFAVSPYRVVPWQSLHDEMAKEFKWGAYHE